MTRTSKHKLPKQPSVNRVLLVEAGFILTFGIIGVILQFTGHAATSTPEIQSVGISDGCISAAGTAGTNGAVTVTACNGGTPQQISPTLNNSGTADRLTFTTSSGLHCLEPQGGSLSANTKIVADPVATCNTFSSKKADYWVVNAGRYQNVGSSLCLTTAANGASLTIAACTASTYEQWKAATYTPPPPPPTPTPAPAPSPSPSPTPSPKPKPKPTPPRTATAPQSATSAIQPTITVTPPDLTTTPATPSDDLTIQPAPSQSTGTPPKMGKPAVAHITTSSATLSWSVNTAANYSIAYGTNPGQPTTTQTLRSSKTNVSVTLTKLPAGKIIYVTVTPTSNGTTGNIQNLSFKTAPKSLVGPIILVLLLLLPACYFLLRLIKRGGQGSQIAAPVVINNEEPIFHQEDPAAYYSRVHWLSPDSIASRAHPKPPADDDVPDMFTEGRKRLEAEEKKRRQG